MKKLLTYLILMIAMLFNYNANGQNLTKSALIDSIDAMIPQTVNDTTPGLVIGIVQNGELIFSKGYGQANLAYDILNGPKMLYNIGSVSKQFLGYAFAMALDEGLLKLDDPVTKYLEDWPEFEQEVNIHHLLSHSSGYREAYTMSSLAGRSVGVDRLSQAECLDVVRKQPYLEFTPGSQFTYNSTAWVILAEIFEKATGIRAEDYVENKILDPLGMHDSKIESLVGESIPNAAESYLFDEEEECYINLKSNRAIFGAADIYSSVEDLAKWINNLKSAEIGGKSVNEIFLEPYILNDGSNSGYALGIGIGEYRGLKRYRHTGGHENFLTQLSYYPEYDTGIILISNYGGKAYFSTTKIADILLEKHLQAIEDLQFEGIEMAKEELDKFAGIYVSDKKNNAFELKMLNEKLTFEGREELIPLSSHNFKIKAWNREIYFNQLPGNEMKLTLAGANSKTHYGRSEKWEATPEGLKIYEGNYWSKEIESMYHILLKKEKLILTHRWLGTITLNPFSKDFFTTDQGFYVHFIRDNDERIIGFNINSSRTLKVFFELKKDW